MAGKRLLDLLLCFLLLPLAAPLILVLAVAVRLTSRGPALYWSDRVGRNNQLFQMPKLRSMRTEAPQLPTHLLAETHRWITPVGRFIRTTSLDELPQLWSILRGDMSFVGPRPALFNQDDLMALRNSHGVQRLLPGITGWAQINGRDELSIARKVELDAYYLRHQSLLLDLRILLLTGVRVLQRDGIRQADETDGSAPGQGASGRADHAPSNSRQTAA